MDKPTVTGLFRTTIYFFIKKCWLLTGPVALVVKINGQTNETIVGKGLLLYVISPAVIVLAFTHELLYQYTT